MSGMATKRWNVLIPALGAVMLIPAAHASAEHRRVAYVVQTSPTYVRTYAAPSETITYLRSGCSDGLGRSYSEPVVRERTVVRTETYPAEYVEPVVDVEEYYAPRRYGYSYDYGHYYRHGHRPHHRRLSRVAHVIRHHLRHVTRHVRGNLRHGYGHHGGFGLRLSLGRGHHGHRGGFSFGHHR